MEEIECLWMVALYPPFAFSAFSCYLFIIIPANESERGSDSFLHKCLFLVRFSVCIVFTIGVAWSVYSRQTGFWCIQ